MRIYKINIEHKQAGLSWSSKKIAANNFREAYTIGETLLKKDEIIEDIQLLETTD